MVRLEKVITEQIFNNKAFRRARVLSTPSKWYTESRNDVYNVASHKLFNEGLTSIIFRVIEPAISYLTYKWARDYA